MIKLKKSADVRARYNAWLNECQDALIVQLGKHLSDSNNSWVTDKNRKAIRGHLFPTSADKCAYCENQAPDLQIDHFYSKRGRDKAFDFDNLLPACGACNNAKPKKGPPQHDGVEMLNPYRVIEAMSTHLGLVTMTLQIRGLSPAGKATIAILGKVLNLPRDPADGRRCMLRRKRRAFKQSYDHTLDDLCDESFGHSPVYIVRRLERLLDGISAEDEYTAVHATLLLHHPKFNHLMQLVADEAPEAYRQLSVKAKEKRQYCLAPVTEG